MFDCIEFNLFRYIDTASEIAFMYGFGLFQAGKLSKAFADSAFPNRRFRIAKAGSVQKLQGKCPR